MNRSTVGRFALFVLLATGLTAGWWYVEKTLFPKPPPKEPEPSREVALALTGGIASYTEPANKWRTFFLPETPKGDPAKAEAPKVEPPKAEPPKPSEPYQFLALGGDGFYQKVLLTSKGAAVQQIILPKFDETTREGRDAKDPETGKSRPLYLIPGFKRPRNPDSIRVEAPYENLQPGPVTSSITLAEPSYTLMHYPAAGDPERLPDDQNPDRFCSRELANRTWKVVENVPGTADAEARIAFETEVGAPYFLKIRKTFTLKAKDYHVGMKLDFEALPLPNGTAGKAPFKYQICGARGLPIEGEWYTSTFRNSIVGWTKPSGAGVRDIQDSASVSIGHGGYDVKTEGNNTFGYAGVANQFFASILCIDETQPEEFRRKMWDYARPTREPHGWDVPGKDSLVDMTVRVASKPIEPAAGKPVSHNYLIYNGPAKVRLLWQLQGDRAVDEGLVQRYHDALHLNTLTDHHSPSWIGRFSSAIYWGDLITWLTNRMHGILGFFHRIVPNWGIDILLLTVFVRLMLFYPSRRQQATMKKMQDKMTQLQPEINKLKEKYKDDPQTFNREKTRLMFQNGANPLSSLGGCLIMIFQIPIFMGLYLCLQESVFFRLESFLWIPNLAAPDMLAWWSEKIPFVADLKNLGEPYYLGPFLNLLPLFAVALMFVHQKMTMPPPMDEQQEMQQKTMKIMMFVMAIFFYKMAAGVCLYFIVSTAWGLAERKLLPKPKDEPLAPVVGNGGGGKPTVPPAPPAGPPGFFGKLKARMEELQKQAEQQRQIRTDYKPNPGGPNGKKKKKK
jgi:YidC/Oxa1 family membrane protein insertase